MNPLEILAVAFALSTDAFCTALGVGTGSRFPGQSFRLAFHFGLFQAFMPAIGWLLGSQIVDWVRAWDHWLAGGIVMALAIQLLWEAIHHASQSKPTDPTRGFNLVSLSLATSIDALAMGLVFAVVDVPLLIPCLTIGVVAGLTTLLGLRLGRRLKAKFGRWLQVGGALVLFLVALNLFRI